jgi:hypothetical protein
MFDGDICWRSLVVAIILPFAAWGAQECAPLESAPSIAECGKPVPDRQQTGYDGGLSARTLPGYTVWQSFSAGASGRLTRIEMGFFNRISGQAELRIYEGDGASGSRLQSANVVITATGNGNLCWNSWNVNVPVVAGRMYTFEIIPCAVTMPDPYGVAIGANNPFPNGSLGVNDPSGSYRTDFDALFRTWVEE